MSRPINKARPMRRGASFVHGLSKDEAIAAILARSRGARAPPIGLAVPYEQLKKEPKYLGFVPGEAEERAMNELARRQSDAIGAKPDNDAFEYHSGLYRDKSGKLFADILEQLRWMEVRQRTSAISNGWAESTTIRRRRSVGSISKGGHKMDSRHPARKRSTNSSELGRGSQALTTRPTQTPTARAIPPTSAGRTESSEGSSARRTASGCRPASFEVALSSDRVRVLFCGEFGNLRRQST